MSPVQISRGHGWLSYSRENEKHDFGAQIDAGSGRLFNIPATNLTLLIGQDGEGYPILLRSGIAGLDNAKLTSDFYYSHNPLNRKFSANLYISNQDDFVKILQSHNVISASKNLPSLDLQDYNMNLNYMAEKRFAGGPLPFDVTLHDKLNGTVLIYPDSLDARGTIETEKNLLNYLESLLNIPEENVSDNVIRIDSNLKSLIN